MTKRTCPTCLGRKPNFHAKECRKCSNKTRVKTIKERFYRYVKKTSKCWEWTGAKDVIGYGRINVNNFSKPAHRVAWEIHNGKPIPDGMSVCHKCDNPPCTKKSHLFLGTQFQNSLDCTLKGRNNCVRKLSAKDIPKIREMYANATHCKERRKKGFGERAIAKKYGVTGSCIRSVITRTTWKHIP